MTSRALKLPSTARVMFNSLREPSSDIRLGDDLFAAELHGDVFVHVGWFPEFDQSGHFVVRMFHEDMDSILAGPFYTRDLNEVFEAVNLYASDWESAPQEQELVFVGRQRSAGGTGLGTGSTRKVWGMSSSPRYRDNPIQVWPTPPAHSMTGCP
jgi:hypothetical protein